MKEIRNGKVFRNGLMKIKLYDKDKDTFQVDSYFNGMDLREVLSVVTIRRIIKDNIKQYYMEG
ncbi:hypothetical protein JOC34_000507 [Virgibacillus halotolerans]|uniref:hypothetical protein n=1 Tax=Virgibacillus halotolerans TaxID=1071053 RepID=UPI00195F298E|nr:hypothetical protein [Virgibacillus halotolerans]MBM7598150.1 hypothetical protein [Virgibacillus halotolerans]